MIKDKRFLLFFFLILAFSFFLRVMPAQNNNFFFTEDQGSDAVWVREIVERGQILSKGPETGIPGVHAGPLWYYFISTGYKLFDGHPYGALFMVIVLNVLASGVLMWIVAKRCAGLLALGLGIGLQFNWFFYDTSRWGFNPFPLVALSFFLVLLLSGLGARVNKYYSFGLIPIFLAFNTEIAGAGALLLFYIVSGILFVWKRILNIRVFLISAIAVPLLFVLPIVFDFGRRFLETRVFSLHLFNVVGTFAGTNFPSMKIVFLDLLARGVIPQSVALSVIIFFGILFLFLKHPIDKNVFTRNFVFLTLLLFGVSFFWFSLNKGWRDWHTLYLSPLIFIAVFLMISSIPKKIGFLLLAFVLGAQFLLFKERYGEFYFPSRDPGLLVNKLKVVDWIYQQSKNDGFKVYVYSPHFWDYPYQYLFWWNGIKKYGYVPCDFRNHPGILKHVYIPGADFYSRPTLGCGKFTFLIIEPDEDISRQGGWIDEVGEGKEIVERAELGGIKVEKRANEN